MDKSSTVGRKVAGLRNRRGLKHGKEDRMAEQVWRADYG